MPDLNKQYENKLLRGIASNSGNILSVYEQAIEEITFTASTLAYQGGIFNISNYPRIEKQVNSILEEMHSKIYALALNGINDGWDLANEKNNIIVDKRLGDRSPSAAAQKIFYDPNIKALNQFIERKEKGLNLSDRVWNTLDPFPTELTNGLGLGMSKGQSAVSMARDLKQYLKNPDMLFRRVKDAEGNLRLSKSARNYHPGQGVYRSSFKNARRLTATETNIAYRFSDWERWQTMPFITGIQIKTSGNHPKYDICDELKGEYPKDFKFSGWHPQCICYQVPIQMTDAEYDKLDDAILNGEDPNVSSSKTVSTPPKSFSTYVSKNADRIKGWKNEPYWLKDNPEYVKDLLAGKAIEAALNTAITLEQAAKAMENYNPTPAQRAAIKEYTSSGYGPINRYLRKGINPTIEKRTAVQFMKDFMASAPKGAGITYRGLRFTEQQYDEFFRGVKEFGGLVDDGFMSTSLDESEAEPFRRHSVYGVSIEIEGKNGVPIAKFSDLPSEKEVLFSPGTEFDIISFEEKVFENGQKLLTLKIKER